MKTRALKTIFILLAVLVMGVPSADAQKTITRKPTSTTSGGGTTGGGGKKPVKKPTTTTPTKTNAMDYVTITRLQIGNTNYDGDILTSYGGTLYADEMKYATPKLTYNCTKAASNVTLYTKIYRPDGTMMTGSSSPTFPAPRRRRL